MEKQSVIEYRIAVEGRLNKWVCACGGSETPFTKNGLRLLYVFNPATGAHSYLDLDTDVILSEEEEKKLWN